MSPLMLKARRQSWPLARPFRISRGVKSSADTVIVEISDGTHKGHGECTPYARYGESIESVLEQLKTVARNPASFGSSEAVQEALPAGAARNALDCALIDFEAKRSHIPAAKRFSITPKPCHTAFSLGIDAPAAMYEAARVANALPILKIKLGSGDKDADHERLCAVRKGAPNAKLIVDANEGWTFDDWDEHLRSCIENNVDLIEQPVPADVDDGLKGIRSPIPICADESLHTRKELADIAERYDAINIKLDKTGGLTEAFAVLEAARKHRLIIMVGCMVASSLAMAPAVLIAQDATWVDLDGPLLLAQDHENALRFEGSLLYPPSPALWG